MMRGAWKNPPIAQVGRNRMPQAASKIELDSLQRSVLQDLSVLTYDEVEAKYGWSRGRIYNLAKRTNARKTEARIAERRSEREQRQREAIEALIEKTTTMEGLDYIDDIPNGCAQLVCTSDHYNIVKHYQNGQSSD